MRICNNFDTPTDPCYLSLKWIYLDVFRCYIHPLERQVIWVGWCILMCNKICMKVRTLGGGHKLLLSWRLGANLVPEAKVMVKDWKESGGSQPLFFRVKLFINSSKMRSLPWTCPASDNLTIVGHTSRGSCIAHNGYSQRILMGGSSYSATKFREEMISVFVWAEK